MAQYAHRRLGHLLIGVAGAHAPTDAEWSAYLESCRELDRELGGFSRASAFIFSDGGAPNGAQLVALGKLLQQRTAVTAVVCDSVLMRVATAILSLINPAMRVFPSRDWKMAATFARIDESRLAEVLSVARELGREVGDVKVLRAVQL